MDIKSSGALLHQCNLKFHSESINVTYEWPHMLFMYQIDEIKLKNPTNPIHIQVQMIT